MQIKDVKTIKEKLIMTRKEKISMEILDSAVKCFAGVESPRKSCIF